MQHIIPIAVVSGTTGILLAASVHDLVARTIPNWMPAAIALLGLAARCADGTILRSALLCGAVFLALIFCWRRGWMGGGDVKLLAAAVLVVPPDAILRLVTLVALAGGVLGLFYLAARWVALRLPPAPAARRQAGTRPAALLSRAARAEAWRIRRGGPLPYACAIAAGTALALIKVGA